MYILSSLLSHLFYIKFDGHGFLNLNRKTIVPNKPIKNLIYQVVAKIKVELKTNSEVALTETQRLKKAQNNFTQFCFYTMLDLNFF